MHIAPAVYAVLSERADRAVSAVNHSSMPSITPVQCMENVSRTGKNISCWARPCYTKYSVRWYICLSQLTAMVAMSNAPPSPCVKLVVQVVNLNSIDCTCEIGRLGWKIANLCMDHGYCVGGSTGAKVIVAPNGVACQTDIVRQPQVCPACCPPAFCAIQAGGTRNWCHENMTETPSTLEVRYIWYITSFGR